MSPSFRTVRRCLLMTLILIYIACLGIAVGIRDHVLHGNSMIVVAFISALGAVGCSYILFKKKFSPKHPQVVGYETTVALTLLPFDFVIILILVSLKSAPSAPPDAGKFLFALQSLVYMKTTIWGTYAVFLVTVSTIVAFKFDKLVWFRDIDASPSPFPPSIILFSLFPWWCNDPMVPLSSFALEHDEQRAQAASPGHFCPPGCLCPCKQLLQPQITEITQASTDSSRTHSENHSLLSKPVKDDDLPIHKVASSSSLSRSLVRIPNDYERRCS